MKRIIFLLFMILFITACSNKGNSSKEIDNINSVDKVIKEQIDKSENESGLAELESEKPLDIQDNTSRSENNLGKVDYDLTNMNSDMVYATVYHMIVDPDTYIGKTFRIEGLYYAGYYELTDKHYHYCLIQDALACCAQGLEFIWEDGNRIYPDEYPVENAAIVVEGTFETYKEDGDDYLYCRLKDASLELINE